MISRSRWKPPHLTLLTVLAGLLPVCRTICGAPRVPEVSSEACLDTAQLVALSKSFQSPAGVSDSYEASVRLAFGGAPPGIRPTAFEENRSFVFALGKLPSGVARRLIVLKPSIFILDDQAPPGSPVSPCLTSSNEPQLSGGRARVVEDDNEIVWQAPPPQQVTYRVTREGGHVITVSSPTGSTATRVLHLIYTAGKGQSRPASATLAVDQAWNLTVPAQNRLVRLWLPAISEGAGEIAISGPGGSAELNRQPLPSGILPHGPEGNRLLELWDADYRGEKPPAWDIGRPADELQKIVKAGTVRKCKVVDLGCGSGTDAIYLASQGFDVTGIDISPTALGQAAEKARKARVSVRWILADVTAPPDLGPFDFIYDRGCYHNVRDQNLEAYIETVRRFSHRGTKLLVLSARRDRQSSARSSGVTEEELRFDFSSLFQVEWLKEIMLESNEVGVNAPGWSALLRREDNP